MPDSQFSRRATSGPFGKCDTRVQTMLPEAAALDIRKRAAEAGVTESEWSRVQLLTALYGRDMVRASLVQQFESMVGTEREIPLRVVGEVSAR
jgi:hypothetical protein